MFFRGCKFASAKQILTPARAIVNTPCFAMMTDNKVNHLMNSQRQTLINRDMIVVYSWQSMGFAKK